MKRSINGIQLNVLDEGRVEPSLLCSPLLDRPETGYSVQDLANDTEDLIRTLGLTRYVLIGHSMGGKVAQARSLETVRDRRGGYAITAAVMPYPR